jgi:hypothetical protein
MEIRAARSERLFVVQAVLLKTAARFATICNSGTPWRLMLRFAVS